MKRKVGMRKKIKIIKTSTAKVLNRKYSVFYMFTAYLQNVDEEINILHLWSIIGRSKSPTKCKGRSKNEPDEL